jgi:hypothetical protein
VGEKSKVQIEDDELDSVDDFDDEMSLDSLSDDPVESVEKETPYDQNRVNARHEIERRNELKALKSELDEWDDLLDDDDFLTS